MSNNFIEYQIENAEEGERMSQREKYEQKAEDLITPILENNGFELVDMEYVKAVSYTHLDVYKRQ